MSLKLWQIKVMNFRYRIFTVSDLSGKAYRRISLKWRAASSLKPEVTGISGGRKRLGSRAPSHRVRAISGTKNKSVQKVVRPQRQEIWEVVEVDISSNSRAARSNFPDRNALRPVAPESFRVAAGSCGGPISASITRPSLRRAPCLTHCHTCVREISAVAASSIRL